MCGCGGAEAINGPESGDVVAVIHPITTNITPSISMPTSGSSSNLSRRSSSSSFVSTTSVESTTSTKSSSSVFTGGRFILSNRIQGTTLSVFSSNAPALASVPTPAPSSGLSIRIHQLGTPCDFKAIPNPVVHSFPGACLAGGLTRLGCRLDLGIGGEGVLGRTVSVCDAEGRIVGEGVIGRI